MSIEEMSSEAAKRRMIHSRSRHGTCHRCGRTGDVHRVTLGARTVFESAQAYRRLCDDCAAELSSVRRVSRVHDSRSA
jgi:hypothetical protein